MRFSCDRCGKRYATKDVPLPGRIYRLKCRACGNVVVVKGDDLAPAAPPSPGSPPAPAEPSAVTPLSDLSAPAHPPPPLPPLPGVEPPAVPPPVPEAVHNNPAVAQAPSSEAGAAPPPVPAAPATPEPRYIELFDARDFSDDEATPPPPPAAPEPIPARGRARADMGDAAPLRPVLNPDDLREAAESLRQPLVDPFARSGEFEAAPLAQDVSPAPAARPSPTPGPARAVSVTHDAHPRPPGHRPAPAARRASPALWIGLIAVILLAAGAAFVVFRPATRETPPASASAGHFPSAPAPTSPTPSADRRERAPDGEKVAVQPTEEKPAPAPQPAAAPPPAQAPATAAAEPAPPAPPPPEPSPPSAVAAQPARSAAKASPPPRAAPARVEKPARPAKPARAERVERKVATAERREAPDAGAAPAPPPAPAAAAAPPAPEADEPDGLTQEQIRHALSGGRKAFDACLRDPWRGLEAPGGPRQITLRFTVAPEGTVGYATIDDVTISGAPVGQCLKTAARGLTFPSFQGDPVKVDAPITIPAK